MSTGFTFDEGFLRRLERLSLRARRLAGGSGGRAGARRRPAADFIDHRPYSPGDDQRHIDWNAAARHDEVFVKIGQAPQAAEVRVLLDLSPSMTGWPQKHRLARELAAALGWLSLAHGDRVAVDAFPGEPRVVSWGPARGKGHGTGLLGHLSTLEAGQASTTALAPPLRRVARHTPTGGVLAVISDLWLVDDLATALRWVPSPRWEVLVLHVLDPDELVPREDGALELIDAETGAAATLTVDAALRARYRAALNARLERVRAVVASRGASHALLPANWSLERAVIPFLRRRALLAG